MLTVHRAESGEALVRALAGVLATPPEDPFTPEVVAVPAKGVERWIAQRLSVRLGAGPGSGAGVADGVCANVDFPWPGVMLDDAVRAVSSAHSASVERWAPAGARWPLLDLVDANLGAPWARTLARHLGAGQGPREGGPGEEPGDRADQGRRMAIATRLAGFFDSYGQARPQMLLAWAAGRFETGAGEPVPADLRWQPELWQLLRERLGPAPAELLDDACARLVAEPGLVALPGRLSVFGASRLSPARLRVLAALAEHREVHLWLHHPSPVLWAVVASETAGETAGETAVGQARLLRREQVHRGAAGNPLLTSMSRDLVELQRLLRLHAPAAADAHHAPGPGGAEPASPVTLLRRLQQALALDQPAGGPVDRAPHRLDPADRSVQVHACHGRTRQVEVLREVVLGLLAADPTLEPRDVLVMCPDVEAFAPLIAAAFSLGTDSAEGHPAAKLRVRLADRALTQVNPLLEVLSRLLTLGTARISSAEVLDLCGTAAVRRRFGFDDDSLERLRAWVVDSGARWGLDAEHRGRWHLERIAQGTWRAGLDRLLLGAATGGGPFGGVLPLEDVDSSDIDLAGRFAEVLDRLGAGFELMARPRTAAGWSAGLERAVLGLAEVEDRAGWQRVQLRDVLGDAFAVEQGAVEQGVSGERASGEVVAASRLGLADVRTLLAGELAGRPTRAGFRTGTMTVCTLVPMRSVPHRVICLLGLDDGSFPRQTIRDGDDLLARDPWIGERDPRSEDRQLFLDAICAAGEHLVIAYNGADERTGARIPPAVPLGELLDELDRVAVPGRAAGAGAGAGAGAEVGVASTAREVVTTLHPLQPFDPRNFVPGALIPGSPGGGGPSFSFDPVGLSAARAAVAERVPVPPFLSRPLPPVPPADVELRDVRSLLLHPARGFLADRLGVRVTRPEEDPAEVLPVVADSLEQWALGERLLSRRLAGVDVQECLAAELLRGAVPPGPLGERLVREVGRKAEPIVLASTAERMVPAESRDVDVQLTDGTRLTGTVRGVRGDLLLSLSYSRLGPKHRLSAWIELVALAAADPSRQWRAVTIGRGRAGAERSELGPVDPAAALATVHELVALYRTGLRAPLPIPLKTAHAYAASRNKSRRVSSAHYLAGGNWADARQIPGERSDEEHVLVHGREARLEVLLGEPPWPGEGGPGWAADEDDRFGLLARRVWDRLLTAERISS